MSKAPDYGQDAPNVVRNLLLVGVACLGIWGSAAIGLWSGDAVLGPIAGIEFRFPSLTFFFPGVGFCAMGIWMVYSSKVGKVKRREHLLARLEWRGDERVLDVGCGRGLMLIGAAKRLTGGMACGIDIWRSEDLSGNRPEETLENARREGAADRVDIGTADMRRLPFTDSAFDIVVSSAAIHNIDAPAERSKAIVEIVRVLKPGGQALVDDIRHLNEYALVFARAGCKDISRLSPKVLTFAMTLITFGSLRPGTLRIRKEI
ncbi:MAG TPA: class I SAM-dependent methyltransferase [Bacteroidota bacterium]|nr:class I SAM-dependent methyltransferase [Bacteroidota bacterium]